MTPAEHIKLKSAYNQLVRIYNIIPEKVPAGLRGMVLPILKKPLVEIRQLLDEAPDDST